MDSCIEPESKLPAPLMYLDNLGVSVENAVKLIVATHWHDDHVRGISTIFDECKSATMVVSNALKADEFLKLAALYRERAVMKSSGLDEFSQVFRLLKSRKQQGVRFDTPRFASADKCLYRDQIQVSSGIVKANVFALSPSDASILQAKLAFAELLPDEKESKKRVASLAPNHASVVLWVEVGNHKMLFGADLEKTTDLNTGWSVILNDSMVISGKASMFKIPHHGSENAHHEGVWSELLLEEPFAVVSPFGRGDRFLPTLSDIKRILCLTPHAFATAPTRRRRQRWRNRVVRDLVNQATQNIQNVHHGWGHTRFRKIIDEVDESWHVELFGDACALNCVMSA